MVVSIQTAIRVRPPFPNEDEVVTVVSDSKQVSVDSRACCNCDYVFPSDITQGYIYDACMVHRINLLFEGHDVYVVVCGCCLSGKSHTLFELSCSEFEVSYGIVPLAIHHIFNTLARFQLHNYFRFSVYINFFEIINGDVNDLLSIDGKKNHSLTTTNKGSRCVSGVENILCRNVNEVFGCLKVGLQSKVGNKNNHEDCNSHTVFIISVYQQWIYSGGYENRVSKATFIDLGSCDTEVPPNDGDKFNFFSEILSHISSERTLNRTNLDSKSILPALIKDAVTISPSTLIICCLSPSSKSVDQTVEYLQLAQQIREQFSSNFNDEPVYDSNTETSSQELDNYGQHDVYISLATSQWMKLIVNAEGLFQKLSVSSLPKEDKQQIDSWLCLKQEYDECFSESPPAPFQKVLKSLECIEEVTESDGNSSSCSSSDSGRKCSPCSDSETIDNGVSLSTTSIEFPIKQDFGSRLENLMCKFTNDTDNIVGKCLIVTFAYNENQVKEDSCPSPRNYRRRKTVLPEDVSLALTKISSEGESSRGSEKESKNLELVRKDDNPLALVATKIELKAISNEYESKQGQIDLIMLDLEGAHKRIEELNQIIKIKEDFISEMIQNSTTRNNCKEKLQKKLCKLEEEYFKTRANLARAEKAVKGGDSSAHSQIEKYKTLSCRYEKRLHDLGLVKQLTGDSAKKVIELETSLFNSKRKLQKLLKQLKKEEQHKFVLERELKEDQKRLRDLTMKLASNSRLKEIEQEEQKLKTLRESSKKLELELQEQRGILEKRESFFKERVHQVKTSSQHFLDMNSGSTEESKFDGEITENVRESLRHEIRNLRKTRDCLVEQRRKLDAKINKDKVFTTDEEKKFLECDEAIDAIDAAIEYKNEIMLGHMLTYEKQPEWEQTDELLIDRLMNLSLPEMRTLLAKYFRKVIDLRESGRKLEQQISEQDMQIEAQSWKIQTLGNALQQANIESERRLIMVHREHQEKLHLMFRQYAGDTSAGSSVERDGSDKLVVQNKALHRRVLELEAMLYTHNRPTPSTALIPSENIQKLSGTLTGGPLMLTKVTRSKNKLIIQQQKSKKRSK